jgi:peptidoglycan hydrolase-like protein with peptidoglycan-binding domain
MDYLIEVSPDQYYGPTTLGAVREFLQMGEITNETTITNCRDATQSLVAEISALQPAAEVEAEQPVRTSIRLSLQARIRELEENLMEERRARDAAELRCEKLEAKLAELSAKTY